MNLVIGSGAFDGLGCSGSGSGGSGGAAGFGANLGSGTGTGTFLLRFVGKPHEKGTSTSPRLHSQVAYATSSL